MEISKGLARLVAPLLAAGLAAVPAGAAADGFGLVRDAGTSIEYQGDPGQDALLTLDVRPGPNGSEVATVDAFNNIDAQGPACTEPSLNHVECAPARPAWTVLSYELGDHILNRTNRPLTATLGGGDDTVVTGDGFDHLFGQDGNDTLRGGGGEDELDGGNHRDFLDGGPARDTLRGGDGPDDLDGGDGDDLLAAGESGDHLRGGQGADVMSAGPGNDQLEGGDGADALGGNEGDDRLIGGPGGDALSGGEGTDRADYGSRGTPLRISLDDVNNDGQDGEGDNVGADIENVTGGTDNDRIVGSNGPNALFGAGGHDLLIGNGGTDELTGGDGDDVLQSRDGVPETVDCGTGTDTAIVDEFDNLVACENVQTSREFQPDVDADGVLAPADCNDRNAAIRPGATDEPHNGVDEDCSGADATLPMARGTVVHAFQTRGRNTRVVRLQVIRAPVGLTVQVACTGRRCPFTSRRYRVRRPNAIVDLTRLFRRRVQTTGTRVEVRVLEEGRQGRVTRFRLRTRRAPVVTRSCLPPHAIRPVACR